MADAGSVEQSKKLKIFISYSRKDEHFAQDLLAGLAAAGFEPYLDIQDIAAGEDWEARLGRLIESADTVLFLISPDSISSQRCAWEVARAADINKRVLPIVHRRVDETDVPQGLKQLNYIFFDRPQAFGASLLALAKALRTDISWLREHTRLSEAALRWVARGRAEALLLRGEELAAAFDWLQAQPEFAPEPSLLHHEFIKAGLDAEAARATRERQRLDQMAAVQAERETALQRERIALEQADESLRQAQFALRNRQHFQIAIGSLLVLVIAGLLGWINQAILKQQANWYLVMRPYMSANFTPHVLTREAVRGLKPGQTFRECATDCPALVVVPAGRFTMGSPDVEANRGADEGPQRVVEIAQPFALSKYPVTFAEWNACVAVGGCPEISDSGFGAAQQPVINVNWDEAHVYTAWLSRMTGVTYRLPTEAEWEYAARAGTTTLYSWGNDIGQGNANCIGCGSAWDNRQTSPVGTFKPNTFGLYDMHGNIWEWVEDCYHDSYDGAPVDGSAWRDACPQSRRSVRGGGWDSYPVALRVANRDRISTGNRINDLGFRVVRSLLQK